MALTRDFRVTIAARAKRDARFRKALLAEGIKIEAPAKQRVTAGSADNQIALDRLNDKSDPVISSAELKKRLGRKKRIKTTSQAAELVARARKRSSMSEAESTRLAVQETRAHRRRRR